MRLPDWLRRTIFHHAAGRPLARGGRRRRFRPSLEGLEDRLTPAHTLTWHGTGGDTNWSNPGNWDLNVAPASGDTVIFDSGLSGVAPGQTTNNISNLSLAVLRYAGSAGGFNLLGKPFTVTGGIQAQNTGGTNDVNVKVTLTGTTTITAVSGATLDLNFPVAFGASLLDVTSDGTVKIAGTVTGTGGLAKDGTGTLAFIGSAANNYGATQVNSGTLVLGRDNFNTIAGTLTVGDGSSSPATVQLTHSEVIKDTVAVTVNSDGTLDLNGYNETLGNIILVDGAINTVNGPTRGKLTLKGTLTVNGSSTSTMTGDMLVAIPSDTITVNGAAEFDINGAISGPTTTLIKNGTGTLDFQGALANTYGATTVNAGTLVLDKTAGVDAIGPGTLTINSAGTVEVETANQIDDLTKVVLAGGTLTIDDVAETLGPVTFSGAGHLNAGTAAVTFKGPITASGSSVVTGTNVVLSGVVTFNVTAGQLSVDAALGGSGGLTKSGAGTLELGGTDANTYTGTTTVTGGTLLLNKTAVDAIVGALVVGDAVGSDVVRLMQADQISDASTASLTMNKAGSFDLNGHADTVGGPVTFSGGTVYSSDTTVGHVGTIGLGGDVTVFANSKIGDGTGAVAVLLVADRVITANLGTLTINAAIGDDGNTFGITKAGLSTLEFSGTQDNTYTGDTTVTGGLLYLNKTAGKNSIAGGTLIVGDSLNADMVKLGQNEQIKDSGVDVTINPAGQFLLNGKTETIGGVITFAGGVATVGTGNLKIAGDVDATAGITLSTSGAGAVTLTGGVDHTFTVAASKTLAVIGTIAGASASDNLVKDGDGTLNLSGTTANTYTGTTEVDRGILLLTKKAGVNAVPANLTVGGAGNTAEVRHGSADQVADTGTVSVGAQGTLNLNGYSDTLGGLLTLADGTVSTGVGKLTIKGGIASTGTSEISGSVGLGVPAQTITVGSGTLTIDATVSGKNAGLTLAGAGTLVLNGNNTYTGTTTATGGTLLINGDQRTSAVSVAGGTVGGTGKIGTVTGTTAGGTFAPGLANATSAMQVFGSVTLNGAPTANTLQIGLTSATAFGRFTSSGAVVLGDATLDINVTAAFSASPPAAGTTWTIIHSDVGVTGTLDFGGVPIVSGGIVSFGGFNFKLTYAGQDVTLTLQ